MVPAVIVAKDAASGVSAVIRYQTAKAMTSTISMICGTLRRFFSTGPGICTGCGGCISYTRVSPLSDN